ncbi:MAG: hypothetical protein J7K38_04660 [Thermoplasmata archaeon]|nr:hypothetical protein [Thermoplasmata archaeon]
MKAKILATAMFSFALLLSIGASLVAIEASATVTKVKWGGDGAVNVEWNSDDDAIMKFHTHGRALRGNIIMEDKNDNPYGYSVDTSDVKVFAGIRNGGEIEYLFKRNDSYEPMYGDAGQEVYTYISTSNRAALWWHSWSNYAQYRSCNYGWKNDNQIIAHGNHYIYHSFHVNNDNGALVEIGADGKTNLTIMNEDHWKDSFKFGKGCGCYTNAKVTIDGSGYFNQIATAKHHLETDTGIEIDGNAIYQVYAEFADGFHFGNFALEGS